MPIPIDPYTILYAGLVQCLLYARCNQKVKQTITLLLAGHDVVQRHDA